jgi:hypothetical protein
MRHLPFRLWVNLTQWSYSWYHVKELPNIVIFGLNEILGVGGNRNKSTDLWGRRWFRRKFAIVVGICEVCDALESRYSYEVENGMAWNMSGSNRTCSYSIAWRRQTHQSEPSLQLMPDQLFLSLVTLNQRMGFYRFMTIRRTVKFIGRRDEYLGRHTVTEPQPATWVLFSSRSSDIIVNRGGMCSFFQQVLWRG